MRKYKCIRVFPIGPPLTSSPVQRAVLHRCVTTDAGAHKPLKLSELQHASWERVLQTLATNPSKGTRPQRGVGLASVVVRYLYLDQLPNAMMVWSVFLQSGADDAVCHNLLVCVVSLYTLLVEGNRAGAEDILLLYQADGSDSGDTTLLHFRHTLLTADTPGTEGDTRQDRLQRYQERLEALLRPSDWWNLTYRGEKVFLPHHGGITTTEQLHAAMDKGDWARALTYMSRVLPAEGSPMRLVRKSLSALESSAATAGASPWEGALHVWDCILSRDLLNSNQRNGLTCRDVGRLLSLLAKGKRWQEALHVFQSCLYRSGGTSLVDGAVAAAALRAQCYAPPTSQHVLRVWAAWRTEAGDDAAVTPEMMEALLRAGVYGPKATSAAVCTAVTAAAAQQVRQTDHPTLPLSFERNERWLVRLLETRWFTHSWKDALLVAQAARTPAVIEAVARLSPSHHGVYDVLTRAGKGAALTPRQGQSLARHWGARAKGHHRKTEDVKQVTKLLDQLLGGE